MTAKSPISRKKPSVFPRTPALFCFFFVFLLAMILRNAQIAAHYMREGLFLCARTVIPSLFPFMVISELLVRCGAGHAAGRILGAPVRALFGLSRAASAPLLLGSLCGFPVGAKVALSLYDRGELSREETTRLLAFCNVPSSGFLIGAVGVSLYGNRRFGVFLFFTALAASLLCGLLFRILRPLKKETISIVSASYSIPQIGVSTFTKAISEATASMLSVCACVVFFSSVVGCLSYLLTACSVPAFFRALLFGVCEISSGVNAAAALPSTPLGAALCGFSVGWSGLSVHLQILSLGSGRGISPSPYLLAKALQGLLCGLSAFAYATLAEPLFPPPQSAVSLVPEEPAILYTTAVCLCFLLCVSLRYKRRFIHANY